MTYKYVLFVFIFLFIASCIIDDGIACSFVAYATEQVISIEYANRNVECFALFFQTNNPTYNFL